jgi:hypothetical protein
MQERTGVYALEEGDVSMVARAWLTQTAERTIDVQYFIFTADNVGLIAVDYLLRAADRGVRVRLLVDDFMLEADGTALLALDAHRNIEIRLYNPTTNIGKSLPTKLFNLTTDFRGFNQRMHNKDVHCGRAGGDHRRPQHRRRILRLRSRLQLPRSRRAVARRCLGRRATVVSTCSGTMRSVCR